MGHNPGFYWVYKPTKNHPQTQQFTELFTKTSPTMGHHIHRLMFLARKKSLGKIAQNAAPPWPSVPGVETPRSRAPPPATRAQRALRALRAGWVAPLGQRGPVGKPGRWRFEQQKSCGDLTMKERRFYQT